MSSRYFSIGEAAEFLDCHPNTLRRWERTGKLVPDTITKGKHRRYSEATLRAFLGQPPSTVDDRKTVLYARVATHAQRTELKAQVETLKAHCRQADETYDEVWTEVASGLKYRRPKFRRLVREALDGKVGRIVVTHRDRLARIGFDLLEDVLGRADVELVVVDPRETTAGLAELAGDVQDVVRLLWRQRGGRKYGGMRAGRLALELAREFEESDAAD